MSHSSPRLPQQATRSLFSTVKEGFWRGVLDVTSDAIQIANDLGDGFNHIISPILSIPQAIIGHQTVTDLSFLSSTDAIPVPTDQSGAHTPTVSQFLNASNSTYALAGTPDGLTPFLHDGKQLVISDQVSGLAAKVWQTADQQVIIAFQGTTGGDNMLINPTVIVGQIAADLQAASLHVSQAQKDAVAFTRFVVHEAGERGIDTNNIFVTGHSLGGMEASYVAQQTGLGGIAFESTGLPTDASAVGTGANFANVVTYGDPVGSMASDIQGFQPFAPDYKPGPDGTLPHYGHVVTVGAEADQQALAGHVAGLWDHTLIGNAIQLAEITTDFVKYHLPGAVAGDLGVSLSPISISQDLGGVSHGPVFNAADDTIAQFITADSLRQNHQSGATFSA